ncbi:MAG: hypothetical protein JO267_09285 [Alphaproteobacteria bacterium]|nr:hypothetical protein [Alphaproteobacteria bacterium]
MNFDLSLLLLGCAALLMSAALLRLPVRARAAMFAVVVGSVAHGTIGSTITDNTAVMIADSR